MSSEVDTSGANSGSGEGTDNDLIRNLRAQLKEAKALNKANDPEVIREQVLAEVNRESTAASLMDKAGFPKLSTLFAKEVDGEPTAEAAAEFLSGLGLTAQTPSDDSKPGVETDSATPAQIAAEVEKLAAAGREAAAGSGGDVPLDELLDKARTADDVTRAMREANLTVMGH